MPNPYFQFKQFIIYHDRCAMKITTDACLFGAWCAEDIRDVSGEIRGPRYETGRIELLDVGTGTGLLSLMIAQKNNCIIDAIEIDKEAAQQAKENAASSPWKDQINVYQTDALEFSGNKKYDVIISNPPFYENELISPDHLKNKAHHSCGLKLSGLASLIKKHLKAHGKFYLLLPYKRKAEAENILRKENLLVQQQLIVSPSVNHSPIRLLIKGGQQPSVMKEKQIFIKDQQQNYTPEFTSLLKDYYLHL